MYTPPALKINPDREGGFSLVELMVVLMIIGILAAIAIPTYMNQIGATRDTVTEVDVRNTALAITDMLTDRPDATHFSYEPPVTEDGQGYLKVSYHGYENMEGYYSEIQVFLSNGTEIEVEEAVNGTGQIIPGAFIVKGWNENGNQYTDYDSAVEWNSTMGGMVTKKPTPPTGG